MKILHTADLHIGKRLEGKSRLSEQKIMLAEIAAIAVRERVDVVLVAGDIFDTASPSPDAKRAFYRFALDCAKGDRSFIAIAGNHDNPDDLAAPKELAEAADIKLVGEGELITLSAGGERLTVAALPYPDDARLRSEIKQGETFADRIDRHIKSFTAGFAPGNNNILLSHLYMTGASEVGDENALGPAHCLPKSILPDNCYIALGHIHKPSTVSASKNAYYSGSPLNYHFDSAADNAKSVIVFELSCGKVSDFRRLPIESGKPLICVNADSFKSAIAALDANKNALVKIKYESALPPAASEIRQLSGYPNFIKIELTINRSPSGERSSLKNKSGEELFRLYYFGKTGKEPTKELMGYFFEVMSEIGGGK